MKERIAVGETSQGDVRRRGAAGAMRRGADNQAEAYEALLARWADVDPEQDERDWQRVKQQLQETRRALGQRLLFPE